MTEVLESAMKRCRIAKAVVDFTGEPMVELLELAGKLCILKRLILVIF